MWYRCSSWLKVDPSLNKPPILDPIWTWRKTVDSSLIDESYKFIIECISYYLLRTLSLFAEGKWNFTEISVMTHEWVLYTLLWSTWTQFVCLITYWQKSSFLAIAWGTKVRNDCSNQNFPSNILSIFWSAWTWSPVMKVFLLVQCFLWHLWNRQQKKLKASVSNFFKMCKLVWSNLLCYSFESHEKMQTTLT